MDSKTELQQLAAEVEHERYGDIPWRERWAKPEYARRKEKERRAKRRKEDQAPT